MNNCLRKRQAGYIFVDICIAVVIMVGVAALVGGYGIIARAQSNATAELTAEFLAQEQLARVSSKGREFLRVHNECSWQGKNEVPLQKNGIKFELETKIEVPAEGEALRRVTIVVAWNEHGKMRTRKIERLMYVGQ